MNKLLLTNSVLGKLGFIREPQEGVIASQKLTLGDNRRLILPEAIENPDGEINEYPDDNPENPPSKTTKLYYSQGYLYLGPRSTKFEYVFFLHELYEIIKKDFPDFLVLFCTRCEENHMKPYLDAYNEAKENENGLSNE